jgi:hypothetical protein
MWSHRIALPQYRSSSLSFLWTIPELNRMIITVESEMEVSDSDS